MSNLVNRKLAAILFADIVGYTALMQKGEVKAMSILNRFQEVTNVKVKKHHGEIIKTYGDGSLILFDSTVDAVQCAHDMQVEFREGIQVPLRIGIHVGEMIRKGDDVFGNGVNIASRVESMGIAGSVLISKNVETKIRNQEGLLSQSLGSFAFKNVEESMEIFALANEGFPIPNKDEIEGKFKPTQKKKWSFTSLILLSIVLGVTAIGLFKIFNVDSSINSVLEESREKRVAVLNFKNQTLDADMDVFGTMISDWLTKGLMETGNANIVNSANLQPQIAAAQLGTAANPEFASSTGIDLIIEGRYYLAESQLMVVANLIEVATGKILYSHQIAKPRNANMALLDQLTDDITSFWAVKDNVQLSNNPPKFKSYQLFLEGNRLYTTDARSALDFYQKSFNEDTSFYAPLFKISTLYINLGNLEKSNEILDYLESRKIQFSNFDKLNYEFRIATREKNYLRAAQISQQKLKMDPSDAGANYNEAYLFNLARYPAKAIAALDGFDHRLIDTVNSINWRLALKSYALKRLEKYGTVCALAELHHFNQFPVVLAVMDLQCLIRMDSLESMAEKLEFYQEIGVYSPIGTTDRDHLLFIVCNDLLLGGHIDYLEKYIRVLEKDINENGVTPLDHSRPDLFNNRPFRLSEAWGYIHYYKNDFSNAIEYWEKEEVPESNWPDLLDRASRLGVAYARFGDLTKANQQLSFINQMDENSSYFKFNQLYFRARILAALGNSEEAVSSLERSLKAGMIIFRPFIFDDDPFLLDLKEDSSFVELWKPKG